MIEYLYYQKDDKLIIRWDVLDDPAISILKQFKNGNKRKKNREKVSRQKVADGQVLVRSKECEEQDPQIKKAS